MRSREFMQADIDIVGSSDMSSDAECISTTMDAFAAPDIKSCTTGQQQAPSGPDTHYFKVQTRSAEP